MTNSITQNSTINTQGTTMNDAIFALYPALLKTLTIRLNGDSSLAHDIVMDSIERLLTSKTPTVPINRGLELGFNQSLIALLPTITAHTLFQKLQAAMITLLSMLWQVAMMSIMARFQYLLLTFGIAFYHLPTQKRVVVLSDATEMICHTPRLPQIWVSLKVR